jgi:hypothetical protein
MVDGYFIRLIAQLQVGDISAVEADLAAASRMADELRQPTQLWEVCAARAMLALAAGRLCDADKLVHDALSLGERAQPAEAIPVYRLQRYTLCDFRGALDEVEPGIADLVIEYPARPVLRCALAHVHARLGRPGEADCALDDLVRDDCSALPFDQEWLFGMSLLAETSAVLGDGASAAVLYRLLLPWASCNAADHPEGIRGSISRYLGLLAATTKRCDEAEHHFEEALTFNATMGLRPWLAHTQHDYARMLIARARTGDADRARDLHAEGLATYRELGMSAAA